MTDYIKADIDFILSGDMGIQYHGVVVFFCGKYFRSTGRRIPMARASGSNDCNISSFFYNSIIRFTVFPSHKLCFLRSFPVTM